MQSDSTTGAPPDHRSLTDLWRDVTKTGDAWEHAPHSAPELHRAYHDSCNTFWARYDELRNQATIRGHAQVEHPTVAWDEQAAVFTTGRFEGRAR